MPEYDSEKYQSRKLIWNISKLIHLLMKIVYSLIHDKFIKFVNDKIVEWNNKSGERSGKKFYVLNTMVQTFKETSLMSSTTAC